MAFSYDLDYSLSSSVKHSFRHFWHLDTVLHDDVNLWALRKYFQNLPFFGRILKL